MKNCGDDVKNYIDREVGQAMDEVPKSVIFAINNLFAMQRRMLTMEMPVGVELAGAGLPLRAALRGIERIFRSFEEEFAVFHENPAGQNFSETRTDLDASIAGEALCGLVVVEVEKPIIRRGRREASSVIQKGVVIVESKGGHDV